jgi:SAM-dependent methyltransferase
VKNKAIRKILPPKIYNPLFGDRERFGLRPVENDECWIKYKKCIHDFYDDTQKNGVGEFVNVAGYKILEKVNLDGLKVLEVGPGDLRHTQHWRGIPKHYVLVDLYTDFLNTSSEKLTKLGVAHEKRITSREQMGALPSNDNEFDLIITFYSLEHLYPFDQHLNEMLRVLKPGGRVIGAIPAEGGLAWGLGRYLTTRRWFKNNTTINPDKIICWEHPTMADEILTSMSDKTKDAKLSFWPLKIPLIDINLVVKFIFTKSNDS